MHSVEANGMCAERWQEPEAAKAAGKATDAVHALQPKGE